MTAADSASSYDCVPYPARPFAETHPDRLATVASLFGMKVQPIGRCRVLELGCACGGNLIPMAEQLPASRFVGIDLSAVQIAEARRLAGAAGLENICFHAMNLMDVGSDCGVFDYVVCHGVFSWVPRTVQEKILEICFAHLAPQGVAYVSYNTYPGWHTRGMVRDMMCYHVSRFPDPQDRIREARRLLEFLVRSTAEKSSYGVLLRAEAQALRDKEDGYLLHDELEDVNAPLYFAQFAARAEAEGLQFLAEANLSTMWSRHLPPAVAAELERMSTGLIEREQYLDFVRNRGFRRTLLCHKAVKPDREVRAERLGSFHVSSPLEPVDEAIDLGTPRAMKFRHVESGQEVVASVPLWKGTLLCLAEAWPGSIPFAELAALARLRAGLPRVPDDTARRQDDGFLGKSLLELYLCGLAELHSIASLACRQVADRPLASRLARLQAAAGGRVTNLRHESVALDDFARRLLPHLDGSNDLVVLRQIAARLVNETGQADPLQLDRRLEQALGELARAALLAEQRLQSQ